MIVYAYNEDGYYIGEHNCQKCIKTGGWLYPARYSEIAPPALKKFEAAKFDGKKWNVVEYNIGRKIYDYETGQPNFCEQANIPESKTIIKPPDPFYHIFDGEKWIIDNDKKAEYEKQIKIQEEEKMIYQETRRIAIENLGSKLVEVKE